MGDGVAEAAKLSTGEDSTQVESSVCGDGVIGRNSGGISGEKSCRFGVTCFCFVIRFLYFRGFFFGEAKRFTLDICSDIALDVGTSMLC